MPSDTLLRVDDDRLLRADRADPADPGEPARRGRSTEVLGPSDSSDTGADMMGVDQDTTDPAAPLDVGIRDELQRGPVPPESVDSISDSGGTGERRSAAGDSGEREAPDISPDTIIDAPGIVGEDVPVDLPGIPGEEAPGEEAAGVEGASAEAASDKAAGEGAAGAAAYGRKRPRRRRGVSRPKRRAKSRMGTCNAMSTCHARLPIRFML
jgi:hypothetical protein